MLDCHFAFILLLLGAIGHAETLQRSPKPFVGIIGAGVGGSTAAWFLKGELGADVHIDM